jgi:L-gulono-1,4-lactone dehydrogenase
MTSPVRGHLWRNWSGLAEAVPRHVETPASVQEVADAVRRARARAGTLLNDLNLTLERLGLSLHNMGDIAEQTLAGATSTGTHGTGGTAAGLAAQLAGLELVTGTGEVVRASATENSGVFDVARVGLGALGILPTATGSPTPTG